MQAPIPAVERSTPAPWSNAFLTRLHRYKALLLRRWWIPVLTICLGLFVEAFLIYQAPPKFFSGSKMILSGQLKLPQGAVYSEDNINFTALKINLCKTPK